MKECNLKANLKRCPCTYEPCAKKGVCCECLFYHLSVNQVPACFFSSENEKTYNRSIENFIKNYKKR